MRRVNMGKEWGQIWDQKWGWRVDFTVEGKRIRKRLSISDKSLRRIASQKAEKLYREEWDRFLNPAKQMEGTRFWQAAKGYVDAGGEVRFLPKIISYFDEDTLIEDINEKEIITAGLAIYPGRAPDTIRRQVRVPISAVIRWAQGNRRRPSTDRKRVRWLTPEEAGKLIDAAKILTLPRHNTPESYTLAKIAFLLGSGCRTGECFAADVKDWNPNTSQLWIPAPETGAGKTNSSAR